MYLENSTIEDEGLLDSATVTDLDTSSDRNIRSDLGVRVDFRSLVDEAGLDNGWARTLTFCSRLCRDSRRTLAEQHGVGGLVGAEDKSVGRHGGAEGSIRDLDGRCVEN